MRSQIFKFAFAFGFGFLGLVLSGVRSRFGIGMMSAFLAIALVYIPIWYNSKFTQKLFAKRLTLLSAYLLCSLLILQYLKFDSLVMIQQTFTSGDIFARFAQMFDLSLPTADTTLLGAGLGSLGARPAEFGLFAMWHESGWLFSPLLIICYLIMIVYCLSSILVAAKCRDVGAVALIFLFVGFLMFGLLAGLSTNFEYSLGLAMFFLVGFVMAGYEPFEKIRKNIFN